MIAESVLHNCLAKKLLYTIFLHQFALGSTSVQFDFH